MPGNTAFRVLKLPEYSHAAYGTPTQWLFILGAVKLSNTKISPFKTHTPVWEVLPSFRTWFSALSGCSGYPRPEWCVRRPPSPQWESKRRKRGKGVFKAGEKTKRKANRMKCCKARVVKAFLFLCLFLFVSFFFPFPFFFFFFSLPCYRAFSYVSAALYSRSVLIWVRARGFFFMCFHVLSCAFMCFHVLSCAFFFMWLRFHLQNEGARPTKNTTNQALGGNEQNWVRFISYVIFRGLWARKHCWWCRREWAQAELLCCHPSSPTV